MIKSKKSLKKEEKKKVLKNKIEAKKEDKTRFLKNILETKKEDKKKEQLPIKQNPEEEKLNQTEEELISLPEEIEGTEELDISKLFLKSNEARTLEESIAGFVSPKKEEGKDKDSLYKSTNSKYHSSSKYEVSGSKYETSKKGNNSFFEKPEERDSRLPFMEEQTKDNVHALVNQDYQPQDHGYTPGEEEEFDNSFLRRQKAF